MMNISKLTANCSSAPIRLQLAEVESIVIEGKQMEMELQSLSIFLLAALSCPAL